MIWYEEQCVGCPPEMGCFGETCPYKKVKICECDNCHDTFDILYNYNGQQLCSECVLKELDVV
ncbi:hypothetical protein [Hungatella hathewayi]|uniref:hypothetical protein n=1 Tax=Hungatella hathewayi TaxID=154046 RepID=UPI0035661428